MLYRGNVGSMFVFRPTIPGPDVWCKVAGRVDTVLHRGVPQGCVIEMDIQSIPPEVGSFDPLTFIQIGAKPMLLHEAVTALHRAAADPRVAGLIARVQVPQSSPGPVQELRAAIQAFSECKPSLAWAETYPSTLSYYLASACREVWMQPSGTVGLTGFATNAVFLRDALTKAGIQAQFVARGEYKSAANLFTEDHYTDAHREADSRLVESLRAQVWQAIAESRGLQIDTVNTLADRAPLLRDDAVSANLIDRIGFRDEAYRRIAELTHADNPYVDGPAKEVSDHDSPDDGAPLLYLSRYAQARKSRFAAPLRSVAVGTAEPRIAIVTVAGPIVSGRGGPQLVPLSRSSAGGDTIAAALAQAGADDHVVAVVLRIDSPGGSVTGSETIWREVSRLRSRGKPVVASMGAVAASGGYYIAMGADTIVANPATITGSIGVVTGKLIARELKDRLGVGSDSVRTNANADAWSINAPFTDEQQALVEAEADLFYADFVRRVAQARSMSEEAVDAVARGRVWTGADALEHGLVDELGGLRSAVRRAAVLAGLDADADIRLVNYPGTSIVDYVRPKASSQPGAASLSEALSQTLAVLVGRSLGDVLHQGQRALNGTSVMWLGNSEF